ncbi:MAG: DHA2 family efflux MFS transporter permease subunit [Alphaproteobacteria bacterium]|nr:DHA2 family efflux MFS transporter permease subunit [Alphaproteobacteria bacterium]MBU1514376.1 DHA2 family efflux MFS transporter permease subunit [Alphaproteobacteria bacterium]MBU2096020.1 DHA2 family efflux MFS transporter permease subunit [Alphaproteobacteria bacterium]MBU2150028.1 DHA2 family efflux MFS transporter permease subunit [Alphaproteobacteria bacterium]MBU2308575.1 DHA2 family efflux MFS transporter permease subunit [Alphaproteobacteria bacterium]
MSQAPDGPAPLTGARLMGAALLLGLANFMVVLDTTIANVSVPHIAGALAVSPAQGTWVITSYAVAEAITVPLTGWLAQRFGPVRVFAFSMAGFGLFSLACGLAPSFAMLVAFRIAQGLCGGPIMPMSQTLLLHIFPKDKGAQALGIWSMTTVVAPIAGPILGGIISDNAHWSWIFLINIPVAAIVGIGAYRMLIAHDTATRRVPVDYVGLLLLVVWVGSLQVMLDKGKELDWFGSPVIVGLAVVAAIGFAAFLIWELTSQNPIVNLRVFRHRGFTVGVITLSLTFGAFFASVVLIPLWLQTTMGYTATWAGYAGCLNGVLAVIMSPIVAKLVGRYDVRMLVSFGVFWMAGVALWRSFYTTDATFWDIAIPQFVLGFAMPFFFIPTTSLSLSSVLPEETAAAAGLQNFLRTTAAAFATSIMTTMWDDTSTAQRSVLTAVLPDPQRVLDLMTGRGLSSDQALRQLEGMVQVQAVMISTNRMFMATAVVFAVAASVIWIAPKPTRRAGPGGH